MADVLLKNFGLHKTVLHNGEYVDIEGGDCLMIDEAIAATVIAAEPERFVLVDLWVEVAVH